MNSTEITGGTLWALSPDGVSHHHANPDPDGMVDPHGVDRRLDAVMSASQDALLFVSETGHVVRWNMSASSLFGFNGADPANVPLSDLIEGITTPAQLSTAVRAPANSENAKVEVQCTRRDGTVIPTWVSVVRWDNESGDHWTICIRDISPQKNLEARLEQLAFNDPLTSLANRALFVNGVEHALKRLGRAASNVGVLFLDLDDFKRINDSFGHAVGDTLLISMADRLRRCVRSSDTVARLGGDEFAILVEDANDVLTSLEIADRVVAAMGPSFTIGNIEIDVSCSVGVALATDNKTLASELLRDADLAMYAAKARGKNCIELYENSMHTAILDRVRLEGDLRHAVDRHQIVPHYQPIYNLLTGELTGFEALARWYHPERGIVEPGTFIDLAETTGLIVPIGRAILNLACQQASRWSAEFPDMDPLSISVNLSSRQIEDASIVSTVASALRDSGLDPKQLTLEITESLVVQEAGRARERLRYISQLGVGIVVDDFGTGYSSLSYLQDLPLTGLKVDRSFVSRIGETRGDSLVHAILAMSKSLGLTVVAEGIEIAEQFRWLAKAGCEKGQGYLFARPLSAIAAQEFLAQSHPFGL